MRQNSFIKGAWDNASSHTIRIAISLIISPAHFVEPFDSSEWGNEVERKGRGGGSIMERGTESNTFTQHVKQNARERIHVDTERNRQIVLVGDVKKDERGEKKSDDILESGRWMKKVE